VVLLLQTPSDIGNALVAQRLEQGSHKPLATGSNPVGRTIFSVYRYHEDNRESKSRN
jgi:hypothetical protein